MNLENLKSAAHTVSQRLVFARTVDAATKKGLNKSGLDAYIERQTKALEHINKMIAQAKAIEPRAQSLAA